MVREGGQGKPRGAGVRMQKEGVWETEGVEEEDDDDDDEEGGVDKKTGPPRPGMG